MEFLDKLESSSMFLLGVDFFLFRQAGGFLFSRNKLELAFMMELGEEGRVL